RDEALFLKVMYDSTGDQWIVTDKSGTQHYFGATADAKQVTSSGTFRWALSKVVDTVGNMMTLTYVHDGAGAPTGGQLDLSSVDYNGNDGRGGGGALGATHRVEFTLEDRNDKSFSYMSTDRVETNKRLKQIDVKVKDAGGAYQLARRYTITYDYSPSSS